MLTRADIIGRQTTNACHFDSSKEAVWTFGVEGVARLTACDVFTRKTKITVRTWSVDGTAVTDLDAALAVLNGVKKIEDALMSNQPAPQPSPTPPAREKTTLSVQIAEIDREIKMREDVYARQVSAGKMRKSEMDYKINVMRDARDSLHMIKMILPVVLHRCEDVIAEARAARTI